MGEDVEAIAKKENARAQAARRDNGVNECMISGIGDLHKTPVAFA